MSFKCLRCGKRPEYHDGPVTGGTKRKYLTSKQEIIGFGGLTSQPHQKMFIECMKAYLLSRKDKNALVRVPPRIVTRASVHAVTTL